MPFRDPPEFFWLVSLVYFVVCIKSLSSRSFTVSDSGMSSPAAMDPAAAEAAAAAAQAAMQSFTIEAWTLLTVGILFTMLRTYARVRSVGFKGLQADDYLVWVGAVSTSDSTRINTIEIAI